MAEMVKSDMSKTHWVSTVKHSESSRLLDVLLGIPIRKYETMVFTIEKNGEVNWANIEENFTDNLQDALKFHNSMVAKYVP